MHSVENAYQVVEYVSIINHSYRVDVNAGQVVEYEYGPPACMAHVWHFKHKKSITFIFSNDCIVKLMKTERQTRKTPS